MLEMKKSELHYFYVNEQPFLAFKAFQLISAFAGKADIKTKLDFTICGSPTLHLPRVIQPFKLNPHFIPPSFLIISIT